MAMHNRALLGMVVWCAAVSPLHAVPQQLIALKVTLVAAVCDINQGRPVHVDFGDNLHAAYLDGQNYLQTVNYQLSCAGATLPGLTLMLSGEAAEFDDAVLATSMRDVGIRVLQNGMPMALNQPLTLDLHHPPRLHAVPVKREGANVMQGRFYATATLRAGYL